MSRIGKMNIEVPEAVNVSLSPNVVDIKGPKGNILIPFHRDLKVTQTDGALLVERPSDSRKTIFWAEIDAAVSTPIVRAPHPITGGRMGTLRFRMPRCPRLGSLSNMEGMQSQ